MKSKLSTTYRAGIKQDSYNIFLIFEEALADLSRRLGSHGPFSIDDPEALAGMWDERRSLYEHLARTADHFWIAEQDGSSVGFSRSVLRDGSLQLTELFVKPGIQSAGVGKELMRRAFPSEGARYKVILASPDPRGQALYLKAGVYPHFPVYYWGRRPEEISIENDLEIVPVEESADTLQAMAELDSFSLGFRRDVDHQWLLSDRQGWLYYHQGELAGYGYSGGEKSPRSGPFALYEAGDFPAVLAHAENHAAQAGRDHFGVEVPMTNRRAVDHLLGRGFHMDSFIAMYMDSGEEPLGRFEHYIVTSPPFII